MGGLKYVFGEPLRNFLKCIPTEIFTCPVLYFFKVYSIFPEEFEE